MTSERLRGTDDDVSENREHSMHITGQDISADEDVYNPTQNEAVRRELRKNIRQLLTKVNDERSEFISDNATRATKVILKANETFANIKTTQDASLDAKLLRATADVGVLRAQKLRNASTLFDSDEFLFKLVQFMDLRSIDPNYDQVGDTFTALELVGRTFMNYSLRVPAIEFMLGPLSIESKKREVRQQRQRDVAPKEVVKPTEITQENLDITRNDTPAYVKDVYRILVNADGSVPYYLFVLNPKSFGNTVENMFYVSFLLKEGKAAVALDEETEELLLWSLQEAEVKDAARNEPTQLVSSITINMWQTFKEYYNITEPQYIPHRETLNVSQVQSQKKW